MFERLFGWFGYVPKGMVINDAIENAVQKFTTNLNLPETKPKIETNNNPLLGFEQLCKQIPEGWFVFEFGQSPAHMLWFCQLILFDSLYVNESVPESERKKHVKRVYAEEYDTAYKALFAAIEKIKNRDFIEL